MVLAFPLKLLSRPARGAWVEIFPMGERFAALTCRAPQGARGLKLLVLVLPLKV